MQSLRDRIRRYEDSWKLVLPPRMPIVLRADGRAFHTLTRGCNKPYDERIVSCMDAAALRLHHESGAAITYVQSDEITCILTPYKKFETEAWFGGEVLKLCSVGASVAAQAFNERASVSGLEAFRARATFDCRAFVVPRDEVINVLVDRQQDCKRNAIEAQAQAVFSHKELHKKDCPSMVAMLEADGEYPLLKSQAYMYGRMILDRQIGPAWDFKTAGGAGIVSTLVYPEDEEK